MAKRDKIIMAWSKCDIEIGVTPEDDSMATSLTSIGTIKDQSATLTPSDGNELEAKETGGGTVAKETQEGGFVLTCRVIEPTDALLTLLGIGEDDTEGELNIVTHIVDENFSVKVTPKNVGARGVKAPLTAVKYKPGWSDQEGNYADIDFEFLHGGQGYWYSIFTKTAPAT